jgi:hypothetical protein
MKAVVFHESADDLAEKAPLHAGPHRRSSAATPSSSTA